MHLPATHPSGLWRQRGSNKRTQPQSGENAQVPLLVHHAAQRGLVYMFWRRQIAEACLLPAGASALCCCCASCRLCWPCPPLLTSASLAQTLLDHLSLQQEISPGPPLQQVGRQIEMVCRRSSGTAGSRLLSGSVWRAPVLGPSSERHNPTKPATTNSRSQRMAESGAAPIGLDCTPYHSDGFENEGMRCWSHVKLLSSVFVSCCLGL